MEEYRSDKLLLSVLKSLGEDSNNIYRDFIIAYMTNYKSRILNTISIEKSGIDDWTDRLRQSNNRVKYKAVINIKIDRFSIDKDITLYEGKGLKVIESEEADKDYIILSEDGAVAIINPEIPKNDLDKWGIL